MRSLHLPKMSTDKPHRNKHQDNGDIYTKNLARMPATLSELVISTILKSTVNGIIFVLSWIYFQGRLLAGGNHNVDYLLKRLFKTKSSVQTYLSFLPRL